MPTIVRSADGVLVVKVYGPPREHPPPHVHVEVGRRRGIVVIRLSLGRGPLRLWRVQGEVSDVEVVAAMRLVEAHEAEIRAAWERIHGS